MRRLAPAQYALFALFALFLALAYSVPRAQTTDKAHAKAQVQKKPPRIPLPGVGGAAPPRRKPAPAATGTSPLTTGPLLPQTPGRFPAPVLVPGQVPGLPGLPGLQARQINPLLFGVALPVPPAPPAKSADPLPALLRSAGVTNVRLTIRWSDVERTKGKPDWRETDRSVRYIASHGFPIVATVEGSPAWSGQPGLPSAGVGAELERFAFAAASRYKGAVNLWEFWSEPDAIPAWPESVPALRGRSGPTKSSSYASLLQAFSRGIRRANPQAQVAVGGLAIRDTRFLSDLYDMGVRASFDAVALHPSTSRDVIDFAWIDAIRALMMAKGDAAKPIWVTDWGWSTATNRHDSVTELHQARLVRQSLAGMRDRPFIVLADYRALADWRQRAADPATLSVTGLLSQALQPKPAFVAFREMATGFNPEAVARYARVPLIGPLPLAEEAGVRGSAIQVLVDASKPTGVLPRLWEGIAQGYEPAIPTLPSEISAPLKTLGARLVRFDPFPNPDWVQPDRIVVVDGNGGGTIGPAFNIRWQYADAMMDAAEAAGAKVMMNLATMPSGLSSPTGNPRMPRDLATWSAFVRQVVRRYNAGSRRGASYWELSSEPNRGDFLLEEWLPLYEAFARAVVAEDPKARVGGPGTAGYDETWLRGIAERCERDHVPLHFLSWHAYGQPATESGRQVESARAWLQPMSGSRGLGNVELILSEWNPSARPSPETDSIAGAARMASSVEGLLNGGPDRALYYTLREGPDPRRPSARLHGGWGLLTHDNRPKAAYNLVRMLEKLGTERIPAASEETDVHAIASRSADRVTVLLWSDPAEGAESERLDMPVFVRMGGLPWKSASQGEQWVLDSRHGDIAGNPVRPSLESAGRFNAPAGDIELPIILAPHSIALVELRPAPASALDLALEAPRYVVYGSGRVGLSARVRNTSAQARQVALTLGGRDLARGRGERIAVTVGPNETKTVPFTAVVDPNQTEGQCFFTVTASTGEAASTSVKLAPALTARLERSRIDVAPAGMGARERTARFRLLLDNRSDRPATLGVAGGSTSVSVTVPPRQVAAVPVAIPVPRDAEGVVTAPVRIVQGARAVETLTAVIGAEAYSHFAGRVPRINGDLAEWADADKLELRPALRDRRGSLSSLSGMVMTMWDDHALYLALSLADNEEPAVSQSSQAGGPPGIQLTVAPADLKAGSAPVFNIDLRHTGERVYRAVPGRVPGIIVPTARVGAVRDGRRTAIEIAIPWSELGGAAPAPGQRLAFALRVNDIKGRGRPGLEYADALPGDPPSRLPTLVLRKP